MTFPIDFRSYPFTSPVNCFLDRHDRRDRRGIGLVPLPGQDQLGVLVTDPIGNGTADSTARRPNGRELAAWFGLIRDNPRHRKAQSFP